MSRTIGHNIDIEYSMLLKNVKHSIDTILFHRKDPKTKFDAKQSFMELQIIEHFLEKLRYYLFGANMQKYAHNVKILQNVYNNYLPKSNILMIGGNFGIVKLTPTIEKIFAMNVPNDISKSKLDKFVLELSSILNTLLKNWKRKYSITADVKNPSITDVNIELNEDAIN